MNIINAVSRRVFPEQDIFEVNQAEGMNKICLAVQKVFSCCRILPQYKYFSRPVYKFIASKSNPVLATAGTFFITDLVIHQFFQGSLLRCLLSSGQNCSLSYDPYTAAFWMGLSVPVMIIKYQNQEPSDVQKQVL